MQWHFEFQDWEAAFELFYRRREREDTLAFVVSIAPEVSGYWIEPASGAESDEHTQVYNLVADVKKLERRIRNKRARTKAVSLGGVIGGPNA
jgi:hypothetical protein